MITPKFTVSQDNDTVTIVIKAPHIKVGDGTRSPPRVWHETLSKVV
jgi:hypothetical protein